MFNKYDLKIRKLLDSEDYHVDWMEVLEYHNEMILTIQHERLIHLLVMIFVGLVFSGCSMVTIVTRELLMLPLDGALMILFIGYIFHYRFLDNTTQSWYKLRIKIRKKIKYMELGNSYNKK